MKAEDRIYQLFAEANPAPQSVVSTIDRPTADALLHESRRPRMLTKETPQITPPNKIRTLRRRGPAVALASFVAVVAVVGAALWTANLGGDGEDVTGTEPPVVTQPPIPSTMAPPDATQPPATPTPPDVVGSVTVAVPDLVGMTLTEARAALAELGLEIEAAPPAADSAVIVAQEPLAGTELGEGSPVIVDARIPVTCEPSIAGEPQPGQVEIAVLFECGGDGLFPTPGIAVPRIVPEGSGEAIDRIEWTLRNLLFGPNEEERIAGFSSFFDLTTADALNTVTLTEGHVVADFNEAILVNNAGTSTGGLFFNAELRANLFQHPEVDSIEFHVNGDCDAWSAFFQSDGCWVITRADWNSELADWETQRNQ
jgi:hypothetical protein